MISISRDKSAVYFTANPELYGALSGHVYTRSLSPTVPHLNCVNCPIKPDLCERLCHRPSGGVVSNDIFHLTE